jgi:hypothetical protein
VEHEHLAGAQEMDARYHLAKLFGLMMTEEGAKYAWQEHREYREGLLAAQGRYVIAPREMTRDEWLARVAEIDRKLKKAGLLKPTSGAMN